MQAGVPDSGGALRPVPDSGGDRTVTFCTSMVWQSPLIRGYNFRPRGGQVRTAAHGGGTMKKLSILVALCAFAALMSQPLFAGPG